MDYPLKPDKAISDVRRQNANDWFHNSHGSTTSAPGVIILMMQRLHLTDLVGHVLEQGEWEVLRLPAIAVEDEVHRIRTPYRHYVHRRQAGEALHPQHEPREVLEASRRAMGEYVFAGQYQQDPVPRGGAMVKEDWFQTYRPEASPSGGQVLQSWDTASKVSELKDYSVCTTWRVHNKHVFLIDVLRKRLDYPSLKRAVVEKARESGPRRS